MKHWLLKTEPGTYSWADLARDKKATWDGVRNFQARNNLREMKKDDRLLIYHSGEGKEITGIAKVSKAAFPDPTGPDWAAVEIEPVKKLKTPVTLAQVKANKGLNTMVLVKASRLSVQPVKKEEYEMILSMGNGT